MTRRGTGIAANDCDIAIIGGGVVGMSLAYGLLGRGLSIAVLDEGDNAFRASRGNFALVWVQGKGVNMPEYARWTLSSANLWESFARDLSNDADMPLYYSRRGGISPCLTESELEQRVNHLTRLHNAVPETPPFEVLDNAQLRAMVPDIGPDVAGGTYCPADGQTNGLRLLAALHKVCVEQGVDYRPNQTVARITPVHDGFAIIGPTGEVRARKVILAAGLGNKLLAPMVGMHAPVHPERGEAMVTEKMEQFLHYPIAEIRQTNEGGVLMGVSMEDAGFDKSTDSRVLQQIAQWAIRVVPRLADVQIVRAWGALRVMTPDGHPIYEKSVEHPGAYLVTCHSGITLAAVHAKLVAGAIADDAWLDELLPFSAQRFTDVPAFAEGR